jgi:hypothetical protein
LFRAASHARGTSPCPDARKTTPGARLPDATAISTTMTVTTLPEALTIANLGRST